MQSQQNNSKRIIIITALVLTALVVLAAVGLIIFRQLRPPPVNTATVSVMKYYMGKTIDDSDLQNIEARVKEIVGGKFNKIEKGAGIVATTDMTNELEEVIDPGDSITITCDVLETREKEDIFNMLAIEYGITPMYIIESFDRVR